MSLILIAPEPGSYDGDAPSRITGIALTLPCLVKLPPLLGASKAMGPGESICGPSHVGGPPCKQSLSLMMTAIS
jgi:hypothetical protein